MYNPISIVNMRRGINLNGSGQQNGLQLNPLGFTPPRPAEEFSPPQERVFSANPDSRKHPVHFDSNWKTPTKSDFQSVLYQKTRCGGCDELETRVRQLEEELRITNLRFDDFQHGIVAHLARLSEDVRGLSIPPLNPPVSRYADMSLATPSVRQEEFESHNYRDMKHAEEEDPGLVIAEACVQLERLIADAKSRLYT